MVCKRHFIANCIKSKGHSHYIISTLLPLPSLQAPPSLCSTILCHHPTVETKLALLPHIWFSITPWGPQCAPPYHVVIMHSLLILNKKLATKTNLPHEFLGLLRGPEGWMIGGHETLFPSCFTSLANWSVVMSSVSYCEIPTTTPHMAQQKLWNQNYVYDC